MDTFPVTPRSSFPLIFISSLCCLAYEIALVRIFSIILWYHFAFMVISIAMLGIGASGTLLAVAPKLKDLRHVPVYGLLLALGIPLSYFLANRIPFDPVMLSWDRLQVLNIGLYYLVLALPFLCFGLIISTAFSTVTEYPGQIYASDLLGAGTGTLLMFWLLSLGGPEQVVFLASALMTTALIHGSRGVFRWLAVLLLSLNLALLILQPQIVRPRMSSYKPLMIALQFPGAQHLRTYHDPAARVDVFTSPAARYAPGMSLTYLGPLPQQIGVSIDGGDIHAITDQGDKNLAEFLDHLPSSLPFSLTSRGEVLVLDPKGGLPLLQARHYNARRITAVESDPLLMRVVEQYQRWTSLDGPVPELHAGLGRAWLASTTRSFDIIDLSFLGSLPAASFGFAEDYRFTVEAFALYLSRLKPDGFLSLNLYLLPPPRMELRLLTTLIEAAESAGVSDISSHIAAIRSWGTLTILFKNSALSGNDIARIRTFCGSRRFDLVYVPGITEVESNRYVKMTGNEYYVIMRHLLDPLTRQPFITTSTFDIRPVRDDNPFVHYFLKFRNIGEIYRMMGEKWQYFFEEGYLLPVLLIQVLVISIILILLPLFTLRTGMPPGAPGSLAYFGAIGLGYLFIESALIQKMVLVLEHPTYAAGTVIASLLAGSGAGSLISQQRDVLRRPLILLVVAGLLVLSIAAMPLLVTLLAGQILPLKVIIVFLLFFPLGFCMGIPLPLGVSFLQTVSPSLIPWAWAVNGCFSVISPILAVMIALSGGFVAVILCAAGLYCVGYFLMRTVPAGR